MQHIKIGVKIIKFGFLMFYLGLLIINLVIKDRFQGLSFFYYASPLPLIMIFGLIVTLFFIRQKTTFYVLASLLFVTGIYFFSHYFGAGLKEKPSGVSSHILFWNAAQNQPLPTDILIKHITQYKPEIVALVEAFEVADTDLNLLKSACPDYHFQVLEGEMMIAVKGTIDTVLYASESDVFRYNYIKITTHQKQVAVMIADVYASPLLNKEIPLDIIRKASEKYKIDILVGDFNTPYESVYFNDLKTDFNSFHPYSLGMTSTWPTPFPLIEIDQIWVKKTLQPIKMKKFCYELSDHKLLIAEYR